MQTKRDSNHIPVGWAYYYNTQTQHDKLTIKGLHINTYIYVGTVYSWTVNHWIVNRRFWRRAVVTEKEASHIFFDLKEASHYWLILPGIDSTSLCPTPSFLFLFFISSPLRHFPFSYIFYSFSLSSFSLLTPLQTI